MRRPTAKQLAHKRVSAGVKSYGSKTVLARDIKLLGASYILKKIGLSWFTLPPWLTLELMRYDCGADVKYFKKRFDKWAQGGSCPYQSTNKSRRAYFQEDRSAWIGKGYAKPFSPDFLLTAALLAGGVSIVR